MRWARKAVGVLLVAQRLELRHLQADFQPQVHGKMRRQRADEIFVPDTDLAQLAAGQESGLAKVIGLNVLGLELRLDFARFQDRSGSLRGLDLRQQPFDLGL